jgi:hypothetical protein
VLFTNSATLSKTQEFAGVTNSSVSVTMWLELVVVVVVTNHRQDISDF